MKSKPQSSSIVKITAGPFCELGHKTKSKDTVDCTRLIRLDKPIKRGSKIYRWCVKTERIERDLQTGVTSVSPLGLIFTETEQEAKAAVDALVANSSNKRQQVSEAIRADAEAERAKQAKLMASPPPPGTEKITANDLKDYQEAREILLRKRYPKFFRLISQSRSAGNKPTPIELQKAYALDIAKFAGARMAQMIPDDSASINQLKWALYRRKNSKSKALNIAVLQTEILRGWWSSNYCWMTNRERANAINKALKTKYTGDAIKMQIVALGITSKRRMDGGRPEKPWLR